MLSHPHWIQVAIRISRRNPDWPKAARLLGKEIPTEHAQKSSMRISRLRPDFQGFRASLIITLISGETN